MPLTTLTTTPPRLLTSVPDDSFSDFVNRITVTGEERNHIEVMFDEERVGNLNGTVGWWGYKKTFDVYYSDDRSRRCRHPRLHVLESATCIGFKLMGGVSEKSNPLMSITVSWR